MKKWLAVVLPPFTAWYFAGQLCGYTHPIRFNGMNVSAMQCTVEYKEPPAATSDLLPALSMKLSGRKDNAFYNISFGALCSVIDRKRRLDSVTCSPMGSW